MVVNNAVIFSYNTVLRIINNRKKMGGKTSTKEGFLYV